MWYAICIGLAAWALIASYYAIKFGIILIEIEDVLEDALDTLDGRYASMGEILEIPLYSDSPEIRRIRDDIQKSQESILKIANALVNDFGESTDEEG